MYVAACLWYLLLTSVLLVGQYFLERHFSRGTARARPGEIRLRGIAAEAGGGASEAGR